MKFKTIAILFCVVLIVIFSLQNAEITAITFLFWSLSVSKVIIILGSFCLGIIIGFLISIMGKRKINKPEDIEINKV